MKHLIIYIALLCCVTLPVSAALLPASGYVLHGKVTNTNGEPVIGAGIYFPDLKTGAVTDANGNYQVNNLPHQKLLVQVSSVGYKMIATEIVPSKQSTRNFVLQPSVTEIAEVAVTGQATGVQLRKLPTPLTIVSQKMLQQTSATNIIDALSHEPGISQITTGGAISKPVIRGLGYNRVVVLNDGIRQEGQQWGDEHGIEIDEFAVDHAEILKGPASLMYGSDAMAGVINLFSSPVLPQGTMRANVIGNYQTNNGLRAYSMNYAGHKGIYVWDIRYSNKQAHAYQNNYDGYVFNSGFSENALSALGGISSWWGYSHLNLSAYHLKPGIVEGTRDPNTGAFTRETADGDIVVPTNELRSYTLQVPYQKVDHYRAIWNSNFILGEGSLKTTLGYQQNNRKEFAEPDAPDQYGLFFKLHTVNYSANYRLPEWNGFTMSAGVNGMYQKSLNLGDEYLVPEYSLFDAGIYATASKTVGKFDLSGGVRADNRTQHADALYLDANGEKTNAQTAGTTERFAAFDKNFTGFSGSVGASFHASTALTLKLNVAKGFRAPNISELGSNGVHEGTLRYETGNTNLKPEQSTQFDWEINYMNEHITSRLNLFANDIRNFIYIHKLASQTGGDSIREDVPVYQFSAGHALLAGGEFYLDIHPHPWDWLHIENSFSYVHTNLLQQPDSMKHLPFTPPAKWTSDLRFDIHTQTKFLKNTSFSVGMDRYFAQNDIYSAYNTETETPAYTLWNASVGTDIVCRNKTLCSLYISGTNLTDVAYQSHLSRLKYGDVNAATGRSGVFNMGRNISIKLVVPVNL